jgi:hypothetical protein
MGTRSLTHFIETSKNYVTGKKVAKKIVTMYRQYDGYPSGMGKDLANFLKDGKLVNGISGNEKVFNGMGCLSAQVVAHLKTDMGHIKAGNVYLHSAGTTNCGEEFVYEIVGDFDTKEIIIKVFEVYEKKKLLFKCKPIDFDAKLAEYEKKEEEV